MSRLTARDARALVRNGALVEISFNGGGTTHGIAVEYRQEGVRVDGSARLRVLVLERQVGETDLVEEPVDLSTVASFEEIDA